MPISTQDYGCTPHPLASKLTLLLRFLNGHESHVPELRMCTPMCLPSHGAFFLQLLGS